MSDKFEKGLLKGILRWQPCINEAKNRVIFNETVYYDRPPPNYSEPKIRRTRSINQAINSGKLLGQDSRKVVVIPKRLSRSKSEQELQQPCGSIILEKMSSVLIDVPTSRRKRSMIRTEDEEFLEKIEEIDRQLDQIQRERRLRPKVQWMTSEVLRKPEVGCLECVDFWVERRVVLDVWQVQRRVWNFDGFQKPIFEVMQYEKVWHVEESQEIY